MATINKEKAIELIIAEINKGLTYTDTFKVILSNFKLSEPTFATYWKIANSRHSEAQEAIKKELERNSIEMAKEAQNRAILSKYERMEIASKIAKGEAWKVGGSLIIPNGADRMKALDYLSRIDGDFAAAKKDITVTEKGVSKFILED